MTALLARGARGRRARRLALGWAVEAALALLVVGGAALAVAALERVA